MKKKKKTQPTGTYSLLYIKKKVLFKPESITRVIEVKNVYRTEILAAAGKWRLALDSELSCKNAFSYQLKSPFCKANIRYHFDSEKTQLPFLDALYCTLQTKMLICVVMASFCDSFSYILMGNLIHIWIVSS